MYVNAKYCVQQGTSVSDVFPCNIGVRQGDNLSPLLFALYLNEFCFQSLRSSEALSFSVEK